MTKKTEQDKAPTGRRPTPRVVEHVDRLTASCTSDDAFFDALLAIRDDSLLSKSHREALYRLVGMSSYIWYLEALKGEPLEEGAIDKAVSEVERMRASGESFDDEPTTDADDADQAWLDAFSALPDEQKARIQAWVALQQHIAETLRVDWDRWMEHYIGEAMRAPFDYSFMEATVPDFSPDGMFKAASGFTRERDPATALVAKVPIGAQNNLGRLSPELQTVVAAMLDACGAPPTRLSPADVGQIQKLFRSERALARLRRDAFRKLDIARDGDFIVIVEAPDKEVARIGVREFGAIMRKPLA